MSQCTVSQWVSDQWVSIQRVSESGSQGVSELVYSGSVSQCTVSQFVSVEWVSVQWVSDQWVSVEWDSVQWVSVQWVSESVGQWIGEPLKHTPSAKCMAASFWEQSKQRCITVALMQQQYWQTVREWGATLEGRTEIKWAARKQASHSPGRMQPPVTRITKE